MYTKDEVSEVRDSDVSSKVYSASFRKFLESQDVVDDGSDVEIHRDDVKESSTTEASRPQTDQGEDPDPDAIIDRIIEYRTKIALYPDLIDSTVFASESTNHDSCVKISLKTSCDQPSASFSSSVTGDHGVHISCDDDNGQDRCGDDRLRCMLGRGYDFGCRDGGWNLVGTPSLGVSLETLGDNGQGGDDSCRIRQHHQGSGRTKNQDGIGRQEGVRAFIRQNDGDQECQDPDADDSSGQGQTTCPQPGWTLDSDTGDVHPLATPHDQGWPWRTQVDNVYGMRCALGQGACGGSNG